MTVSRRLRIPRLVRFCELGHQPLLRQSGIGLFRQFIDEQGTMDPIYGWDGGDDADLQRTWGGWDNLYLYEAGGEAIGLVSWMSSDFRILPLSASTVPGSRRAITLTNLYIAPEHRRAGHAAQMIRALLYAVAEDPPIIDLGGDPRPASHMMAATHGWNPGAQAALEAGGFGLRLIVFVQREEQFLARRRTGGVGRTPAGFRLERGDLVIQERQRLDARIREQLARLRDGPGISAAWYTEAFGLSVADKAAHLFGEAVYRVERAGELVMMASFSWSLNTLPRQFVVECLELHARPDALLDPEIVSGVHELLYERLSLVHRAHTGRTIEHKDRILRMPLLLPAAERRTIGTRLEMTEELLHYSQPLPG